MTWSHHQAYALSLIFSALNSAGITWLVLRNHEGLPDRNRSKDVDLGLHKREFSRAHAVIAAAALKAGFDRQTVDDFQYVRCVTFFGLFERHPQSLKIDLLDGFTFRGAQVFDFPQLIVNATRVGDLLIPDKVQDAVMLWMKPLLTGGIVKNKYLPDIRWAAQQEPLAFRMSLECAFSPKWGRRVWQLIESGDIGGTIALQRPLRRAAWWTAFRREPSRTLRDTAHHIVAELARRSRRKQATFLAVVGPDGVGKSTFIENFALKLADLQVKDRNGIIVRHFRPRILPNIKTLLTGMEEGLEEFNKPHRAKPASRAGSFLRLTYYWIDYVLGYWGGTRHECIRGRTVIFDRYFFDFLVDPRRSRLSLPTWITRMFLFATPKPDFVFFLDSFPDLIYSRKQELHRHEISRQLVLYRSLAAGDPDRFIRLDASQIPDQLVAEALQALILRSYSRFAEPLQ